MTLTLDSHTDPARHAAISPFVRLRLRHIDAPANALLLGALWFVYAAVRNLTSDTHQAAIGNAARLLDAESALGIDIEGALQSAIDWPQAFVVANTYYLLHFPLTLTVMALAFWRGRTTVFSVLRNSLIGCTAIALVIHLVVPMAPPRMLPGFVDAGATFGPDPYAVAGSGSTNQFAAMPSMHVAWAILVGYAIWHLSAHRVARIVSILHPLSTSLVVIVTGHHFVSDVAIGAGLAFVLLLLTTRLSNRRHRRPSSGGPESLKDMTISGVANTRLPDDRTVSVLHTEIETTTTRIHGRERSRGLRPPTAPTDDPPAASQPARGGGRRPPSNRRDALLHCDDDQTWRCPHIGARTITPPPDDSSASILQTEGVTTTASGQARTSSEAMQQRLRDSE